MLLLTDAELLEVSGAGTIVNKTVTYHHHQVKIPSQRTVDSDLKSLNDTFINNTALGAGTIGGGVQNQYIANWQAITLWSQNTETGRTVQDIISLPNPSAEAKAVSTAIGKFYDDAMLDSSPLTVDAKVRDDVTAVETAIYNFEVANSPRADAGNIGTDGSYGGSTETTTTTTTTTTTSTTDSTSTDSSSTDTTSTDTTSTTTGDS
jgi:hypothetical protein